MDDIVQQLAETCACSRAQNAAAHPSAAAARISTATPPPAKRLSTSAYRGIVEYEPTELVITARAGTPLAEIEAALRDKGQMLAFEPPHFGATALDGRHWLGGCIAAGLSGPRRPYAGAVRDLRAGRAHARRQRQRPALRRTGDEECRRLRCVAPDGGLAGHAGRDARSVAENAAAARRRNRRCICKHSEADAIRLMNEWAGQAAADRATAWRGGDLGMRLSGARSAVEAARQKTRRRRCRSAQAARSGAACASTPIAFFAGDARAAVAAVGEIHRAAARPARRTADRMERRAALAANRRAAPTRYATQQPQAGGHATLFRRGSARQIGDGVFHPLSPALARLHRN